MNDEEDKEYADILAADVTSKGITESIILHSKEGKSILSGIISKGIAKAIFPHSSGYSSYREIWEEVIGEMLDALAPGSSEDWKQLPAELQDKIAEMMKFNLLHFLDLVDQAQDILILKTFSSSIQQ